MIFHFVHEFPIQQIFDKVDDSVVAGWLMRRSVVDPKRCKEMPKSCDFWGWHSNLVVARQAR